MQAAAQQVRAGLAAPAEATWYLDWAILAGLVEGSRPVPLPWLVQVLCGLDGLVPGPSQPIRMVIIVGRTWQGWQDGERHRTSAAPQRVKPALDPPGGRAPLLRTPPRAFPWEGRAPARPSPALLENLKKIEPALDPPGHTQMVNPPGHTQMVEPALDPPGGRAPLLRSPPGIEPALASPDVSPDRFPPLLPWPAMEGVWNA